VVKIFSENQSSSEIVGLEEFILKTLKKINASKTHSTRGMHAARAK